MNSEEENRDPFIWPYRDTSPVGPLGNGAKELREIERLIQSVQVTEIYTTNHPGMYKRKGIVTDTLVSLDEVR